MPGPPDRTAVRTGRDHVGRDHGGSGDVRPSRPAWPGDTRGMLRTVNWLARAAGLAWLGVLSFVLVPPGRPSAEAVQIAGYGVLAAALVAWTLTDLHPAAARHRARAVPVILGIMAAAAGGASGAGGGGSSLVIFGFVAAMVAGSDSGLAGALAVTGAGILATEVSGLALGGSYATLLGLPALVVSGLVVGRNRGAYRIQAEQAAALLAQREQLQSEQRRADLLDERARIAREIHDVLAHSLGALGIQIQAARAVLADHGDIRRADEVLATAQRIAAAGLEETRQAVHALRVDTLPLDQELARVSETHGQRYGVDTTFEVGGVPVPLPPDATITLLRIAQESLVNAAKHAAGQPVAIRLDYGGGDVRLTVRNDLARGGEPARTGAPGTTAAATGADADGPAGVTTVNGGYGLTGMRERLLLLDGILQAGRRDDQWIVTAELARPRESVMS
jgi:signal transduction histidine kinase